jgi:hypothetical protein
MTIAPSLPIPSQTLPAIATTATVADGPETGLSTRADPTSGVIAAGVRAGQKYPARWMNWLLGGLYDWVAWLRESASHILSSTERTMRVPLTLVSEQRNEKSPSVWELMMKPGSTGVDVMLPVLNQAASDCVFVWPLSDVLPSNGLLTGLSISVQGDAAWNAHNPTNMPVLGLWRVGATGSPVAIQTFADPSITTGEFQALHSVGFSLTTPVDLDTAGQTADPPYRLFVVIAGAVHTTDYYPTYYRDLCAQVKSKAWTGV